MNKKELISSKIISDSETILLGKPLANAEAVFSNAFNTNNVKLPIIYLPAFDGKSDA